jgi:hypothetical protein
MKCKIVPLLFPPNQTNIYKLQLVWKEMILCLSLSHVSCFNFPIFLSTKKMLWAFHQQRPCFVAWITCRHDLSIHIINQRTKFTLPVFHLPIGG